MAYNHFAAIGHLAKDGEFVVTDNGKQIYRGVVAIDYGWGENKKTSFVNFVYFGKPAEFIANNARKGMKIHLSGGLVIEQYETKDGEKKYTTKIMANAVELLEKPQKQKTESKIADVMPDPFAGEGTEVNDDDLPF